MTQLRMRRRRLVVRGRHRSKPPAGVPLLTGGRRPSPRTGGFQLRRVAVAFACRDVSCVLSRYIAIYFAGQGRSESGPMAWITHPVDHRSDAGIMSPIEECAMADWTISEPTRLDFDDKITRLNVRLNAARLVVVGTDGPPQVEFSKMAPTPIRVSLAGGVLSVEH